MIERPSLIDFSAGELSPDIAGRIDLSLVSHGCEVMTNFEPDRFGNARKRGGLKYLYTLTGAARIIPWKVGSLLTLYIVIYSGSISFLVVKPDGTISTINDPVLGAPLSITHLDGGDGRVDSYTLSEAEAIQYAQNLDEITLVCGTKPAFWMKYTQDDGSYTSVSITYGIYAYVGNVARNPPVLADDILKEVAAVDLIATLQPLPTGTTVNADSGSFVYVGGTKYDVTSVKMEGSVTPRSFSMTYQRSLLAKKVIDSAQDASTTIGDALAFGTQVVAQMFVIGQVVDPVDTTCVGGTTYTQLLDKFEAAYGKSMRRIYIGDQDGGVVKACGICSYSRQRDSRKVTITHSGGTLVITPSSAATKLYLKISEYRVEISGGYLDASTILNSTIPWMDKNVDYPCDSGLSLAGSKVVSARRLDTLAEPGLEYWVYGDSAARTLTHESPGLLGQIGVILTPFYSGTEFPTHVAYWQGRLVLASKNVIYMSKVNDYQNFCYFEEIEFTQTSLKAASEWANQSVPETRADTSFSQQVLDTSAIKLILATDESESVKYLAASGDLVIGTSTSEWIVPSGSTANNVQIMMLSRSGNAPVQSRFAMGGFISVSATRRIARIMSPRGGGDSEDLTKFASHIAKAGIVYFDFRSEPDEEVIFVLADGSAVRVRKGVAGPSWSRISPADGGLIVSLACASGEDEDTLDFVVRRGGSYHIERLVTPDDSAFPTALTVGRAHLDSYSYIFSVPSLLTIPRLAGKTAAIHFNSGGGEVRGTVTFNGSGEASTFTREGAASAEALLAGEPCIVGLPFSSRLKTFRIDSPTTEGLVKGPGPIHLRLLNTGKFFLQYGSVLQPINPPLSSMGAVQYPYSGPVRIENPAGNNVDVSLDFVSQDGVPVTIQCVVPTFDVATGA